MKDGNINKGGKDLNINKISNFVKGNKFAQYK